MDENKLREIGLTDEQAAAVLKLAGADEEAIQKKIAEAVGLKEQELTKNFEKEKSEISGKLAEREAEFAAKEALGGYKFTSSLARERAFELLKGAGLELKDGKLDGADEFFEKLKADYPEAFDSGKPYVEVSGGGGSAAGAGAKEDGVEAAFYSMNPDLK